MSGNSAFLKKISKVFLISAATFVLWGCVQPQPAKTSEMAPAKATTDVQKEGTAEKDLLAAESNSELQNTDCTKCHNSQPADVKRNGGKHKTEVACLECHLEHLPLGTETIPQCSMCHESSEREHFKLENCLSCHRNPHTPLDITVDDVPIVSTGCKTCHGDKGEEFKAFPSMHAEQNCTLCHPTKHKRIHKCLTCHEPHAEFMAYEDCLRCHQPHSPLNIKYADDTPSKYCGSCHGELYQLLSNNKSKHNELNCAYCHKTNHPTVPNCSDCHDSPHSSSMLKPFNSDCLKCHRNPHDLIF